MTIAPQISVCADQDTSVEGKASRQRRRGSAGAIPTATEGPAAEAREAAAVAEAQAAAGTTGAGAAKDEVRSGGSAGSGSAGRSESVSVDREGGERRALGGEPGRACYMRHNWPHGGDQPERNGCTCGTTVTDDEIWSALGMSARFPTTDMLYAAAALFTPAELGFERRSESDGDGWRWRAGSMARGYEADGAGPRCAVTVGPGVVRLAVSDPVRRNRALNREPARRRHDVAVHEADLRESDELRPIIAAKRRAVSVWSAKSRLRMMRTISELDLAPLVRGAIPPAMATLTYPGCWLRVAPGGATVKRHFAALRRRFERRWDRPLRAIWKLEFQGRRAGCSCDECAGRDDGRAPHLHLWLVPPADPGFAGWLSAAWANIVDHPDPTQRARHERAGTAVDRLAGIAARDVKRLAVYFLKHASPNALRDKEYHHRVPEAWAAESAGPGRFWGYIGIDRAVAGVLVDVADFVSLKRLIRRWSRSQAAYGRAGSMFPSAMIPRTARVQVKRGSGYRWTTVRRPLCGQSGLCGGFALVNDGAAFASMLARATALSK